MVFQYDFLIWSADHFWDGKVDTPSSPLPGLTVSVIGIYTALLVRLMSSDWVHTFLTWGISRFHEAVIVTVLNWWTALNVTLKPQTQTFHSVFCLQSCKTKSRTESLGLRCFTKWTDNASADLVMVQLAGELRRWSNLDNVYTRVDSSVRSYKLISCIDIHAAKQDIHCKWLIYTRYCINCYCRYVRDLGSSTYNYLHSNFGQLWGFYHMIVHAYIVLSDVSLVPRPSWSVLHGRVWEWD